MIAPKNLEHNSVSDANNDAKYKTILKTSQAIRRNRRHKLEGINLIFELLIFGFLSIL
jgi:hypothetical protein